MLEVLRYDERDSYFYTTVYRLQLVCMGLNC